MNRHLKLGKGLVVLACLMVLLCMNQRAVGERLLGSFLAPHSSASAQTNSVNFVTDSEQNINSEQQGASGSAPSTCELSTKSLIALLPTATEPFFFMFLLLAALILFCTSLSISRANNEEKHAPPRVRRHLQFCNLRN